MDFKSLLNGLANQIIDYHQKQDYNLLQLLWEQVSEYVRFYPTLAFRERDDDRLSDFYLYIFERRESLFNKYNPSLAVFSTYLSIRLRTYYLNFIAQEKIHQKIKITYADKEEIFAESKDEALALRDDFTEDKNLLDVKIIFPDSQNDTLKYLVIKLYYFDFFSEDDFLLLKSFTGKNYMSLLKMINDLKNKLFEKVSNQLKIDEKINKVYFEILSFQEKKSNTLLVEEKITMEKEINLRRKNLLEKYKKISVFPPFKIIAEILSQSEVKVANLIVYYKKTLEKTLKKNFLNYKE